MARSVICLGVFALGLAIAVPAGAQTQHQHGYIAVSKMQIDPRMEMLSDGPAARQASPQSGAPMAEGDADSSVPLDQLGAEDQSTAMGDDPVSDNAVETDTVYTA